METTQVSPALFAVQFPPVPVASGTIIGLIAAIVDGSVVLPSIDVMSTSSCVLPGET